MLNRHVQPNYPTTIGSPEAGRRDGGGRAPIQPIGGRMICARRRVAALPLTLVLVSMACASAADDSPLPTSPGVQASTASNGVAWGPETPNFNLEVILRGDGFGHVKFRQPNDDEKVVYLDTWVRGLAPNRSYLLQRAVDTTIDDNCTSSAWLTLGKGTVAQTIDTDDRGTGTAELFRSLAAAAVGATFDIHFRVIDAITSAVVLESSCYQFTVSL